MCKTKSIIFFSLLYSLCSFSCYASENENLIQNLQNKFNSQVSEAMDISSEEQVRLLELVNLQLQKNNIQIKDTELGIIVDRGIKQQTISIVLMYPNINDWEFIGQTHVSTGKPGRKEHFKTPVGVFKIDGSILGYRALGTFNENHIRGNGIKGMRVWDFGWQTTEDWRTKNGTMDIRMEMHATDPANLAKRFGRPDSEGCIRIPGDLNEFIDQNGILDKDVEIKAKSSKASKALLGNKHQTTGFSGDLLIVVDGGDEK
jgi:hypothetical protein